MAAPAQITDRAKRYRAVNAVEGPMVCVICGVKPSGSRPLDVMHLDGNESHGERANLAYGCRSCNGKLAAAFKRIGAGVPTRQYNPKKGVSPTFEQYAWAVSNHDSKTHAHDEGGAIIHATPKHKRIEYARRIAGIKEQKYGSAQERAEERRRAHEERWNPNDPQLIRQAETSRSVEELARLHAHGSKTRHAELVAAVDARAKQLGIRHEELMRKVKGNPLYDFLDKGWYAKGQHASGSPDMGNAFLLAWARSNAQEKSAGKKLAQESFYWGHMDGKGVRRNPEFSSAALYESFHGKPSTEVLEITEEVHEHENLAVLGRAVECWIETPTGLLAHIQFDQDEDAEPVFFCSSEDGRQLYFEGGDQSIDLKGLKMDGEEWVKDRMVLGQFAQPESGKGNRKHNVTYSTKKDFDAMEQIDYQHDLGEVTGVRPLLEYDARNNHLYVSGGQYHIEQPLLETSPGIEN